MAETQRLSRILCLFIQWLLRTYPQGALPSKFSPHFPHIEMRYKPLGKPKTWEHRAAQPVMLR